MSACLRLVFINLTPQLMSKPTPPGETIPFFSLNAATPSSRYNLPEALIFLLTLPGTS